MQGNYSKISLILLRSALLLCLISWLTGGDLAAQGNLIVFGKVKDKDTAKSIAGVQVTVKQNGKSYDAMTTSANGEYRFDLPLGSVFDIRFDNPEYVHKILRFDAKSLSEQDMKSSFEKEADLTLFEKIDGFNEAILDEPIGIYAYDSSVEDIEYDPDYTRKMFKIIDAEFKRVESAGEELEARREEFTAHMASGDKSLSSESYQDAVGAFEKALALFPDNKQAQDKLASARAKQKESEALAAKEGEFNNLVKEGDAFMKAEKWTEAEARYNSALVIKPQASDLKLKLQQIAKIRAEQENQAAYDKLIKQADDNFGASNYAVSIENYEAALKLKPTEAYPKGRIKEAKTALDTLLAAEEAKRAKEQKYQELITLGDRNAGNKEYEYAIKNYREALEIKPNEAYPAKKVTELETLMAQAKAQRERDMAAADQQAERAALEAAYQARVDTGNKFFAENKLEEARLEYQEALTLKSEEKYPKSQIDLIAKRMQDMANQEKSKMEADALQAEKNRIDETYQALISSANDKFEKEQLEAAKADYEAALQVKPNEKFPQSRIQRIGQLQAEAALAMNSLDKEEKEKAEAAERARLKAEQEAKAEQARLEREEKDRAAAAKRAEEMRLAAEHEAQQERRKQERAMHTVDSATEEDVERYYRDARESEEKAKGKRVAQQKEANQILLAEKGGDAAVVRMDNLDRVNGQKEDQETLVIEGLAYFDEKQEVIKAEKDVYTSSENEQVMESRLRRDSQYEKSKEKEAELELLSENDVYREAHVMNAASRKTAVEEKETSDRQRGAALRADAVYETQQQKVKYEEMETRGELVRQEHVRQSAIEKEVIQEQSDDLTMASQERRSINESMTQDKKEQAAEMPEQHADLRQDHLEQTEQVKAANESSLSVYALNAKERALENAEERKNLAHGEPKQPEEFFLAEGAQDIPEGVTEQSYDVGNNKTVIERTVKIGNQVNVYRKVVSKTGIYYFKNGNSISETIWQLETLQLKD